MNVVSSYICQKILNRLERDKPLIPDIKPLCGEELERYCENLRGYYGIPGL